VFFFQVCEVTIDWCAVQEIQPRLDELIRQWKELEETTAAKGEKLFDANRHVLYEQSCDDIDGWINEIESQIITDDVGHDLTTVNLLVQKQNVCLYLHQLYRLHYVGRYLIVQKTFISNTKLQPNSVGEIYFWNFSLSTGQFADKVFRVCVIKRVGLISVFHHSCRLHLRSLLCS